MILFLFRKEHFFTFSLGFLNSFGFSFFFVYRLCFIGYKFILSKYSNWFFFTFFCWQYAYAKSVNFPLNFHWIWKLSFSHILNPSCPAVLYGYVFFFFVVLFFYFHNKSYWSFRNSSTSCMACSSIRAWNIKKTKRRKSLRQKQKTKSLSHENRSWLTSNQRYKQNKSKFMWKIMGM